MIIAGRAGMVPARLQHACNVGIGLPALAGDDLFLYLIDGIQCAEI